MPPSENRINSVCAVIVAYHSAPCLAASLGAVKDQAGLVIVVDNSTQEEAKAAIAKICEQYQYLVEYIPNPENNLAAAQNIGIRRARDTGHHWVLLLDDDSKAEPGMVETLLSAYESHPDKQSIGIVAPYIRDENIGEEPFYYRKNALGFFARNRFSPERPWIENVMYVCAAGSLIPMDILDKVGPMNEDFSIYFVDTEFCLRTVSNGFSILAVRDAVLSHQIGKRTEASVFGIRMTTTNHAPQSRYFMARNRIKMWKKFACSQPSYIFFDSARCLYEIIRIALLEADKPAKFRAIIAGFKEGLCADTGKKID